MREIVVAVLDVGAVRNIGFWRSAPDGEEGGQRLGDLADLLAADLDSGRSVALGFEAPLFVPLPQAPEDLNRQRVGERGRPWCAGAGTGAFAMGAQQSAWLLREIARTLRTAPPPVTFSPAKFAAHGGLLIWEAFVSGAGKDRSAIDPHIDDARRAAAEFRSRLDKGVMDSDITDTVVFNVVGAALIAAGLSTDATLLSSPCTVVRVPDLVV